jgi:hypothetical protein
LPRGIGATHCDAGGLNEDGLEQSQNKFGETSGRVSAPKYFDSDREFTDPPQGKANPV